MELFYAYVRDTLHDDRYRYLITFVDRAAADEWWRLISTPPSPYAGNVKRISPQFYVQNTEKINVINFFNTALPGARQFRERMFFTFLDEKDGTLAAPPTKITDHVSGKWYFIRSRDDPRRHWYFRGRGYCLVCGDSYCEFIHVSTEYRTRFRIQTRNSAENGSQAPKDFVLIGRDAISITPTKDYSLYVDNTGNLKAIQTYRCPTTNILFSDLKHTFVTHAEGNTHEKLNEVITTVDRGSGEAWELFD